MNFYSFFFAGILNKHLDWSQDKKKFQAWKEGRTGVPFVDANMRELKVSQFQIANKNICIHQKKFPFPVACNLSENV